MLKNIFDLFYPDLCVNCEKQLYTGENILCSYCLNELALIEITDYKNNEIINLFFGKTIIEKAYSFLYYHKKSIAKCLISNLKYKNRQDIGVYLGDWFGNILKEKKVFDDVDIIIPVPLHQERIKERGYNQIIRFTERLSTILSIPYKSDILIRKNLTKTQTKKNRFDRFLNMQHIFEVTDNSFLENKHILLVDDVITTGATLYACCDELNKTKNINISIATIAFTKQN